MVLTRTNFAIMNGFWKFIVNFDRDHNKVQLFITELIYTEYRILSYYWPLYKSLSQTKIYW